jgi:hypothetical protein
MASPAVLYASLQYQRKGGISLSGKSSSPARARREAVPENIEGSALDLSVAIRKTLNDRSNRLLVQQSTRPALFDDCRHCRENGDSTFSALEDETVLDEIPEKFGRRNDVPHLALEEVLQSSGELGIAELFDR